MRGKRIRTLEQLEQAALDRRAISCGTIFKRTPAAFMLSMQAREVLRFLRSGMFIYKPKTETKAAPVAGSDDTTRCCEAGVGTLRGAEQDGNRWTCTCGKSWMYVEDEADGGAWHRIENTKRIGGKR
jgi:hypothetical protein